MTPYDLVGVSWTPPPPHVFHVERELHHDHSILVVDECVGGRAWSRGWGSGAVFEVGESDLRTLAIEQNIFECNRVTRDTLAVAQVSPFPGGCSRCWW